MNKLASLLIFVALSTTCVTAIGFSSDQTPKFGTAQKRTPIVIVESHHAVLKYWLRSKALPNDGVAIVHFDSHPDMGIPKFIPRRLPKRASWMEDEEKIDIASFQLAAVWTGLVNEIVWVKPPWSEQIPDMLEPEEYVFGVQNATDPKGRRRFRVSSTHDYWLSNGYTQEADTIGRPRKFTFRVIPFEKLMEVDYLVKSKYAILDIDMDFFATKNTGTLTMMERFTEEEVEALKATFNVSNFCLEDKDWKVRMKNFSRTLSVLRTIKQGVFFNVSLDEFKEKAAGLINSWCPDVREEFTLKFWEAISRINDTEYLEEVATHLHGNSNLPLMYTGPEKIRQMVDQMKEALEYHAPTFKPKLVTMARSVEDEFTPVYSFPLIEWSCIDMCKHIYLNSSVRYDVGMKAAPSPTGSIANSPMLADYLSNMSVEDVYDHSFNEARRKKAEEKARKKAENGGVTPSESEKEEEESDDSEDDSDDE